jgi:hypothetical protein
MEAAGTHLLQKRKRWGTLRAFSWVRISYDEGWATRQYKNPRARNSGTDWTFPNFKLSNKGGVRRSGIRRGFFRSGVPR